MRWFRAAAVSTTLMTQLMAIAITAAIIAMLTNSAHARSIDGDPSYNGFLFYYILILVFQVLLVSVACLGCWIAFKNWKNNYQMDHSQRTRFVSFLSLWCLAVLGNCGIAIYCIVQGKQQQQEMAHLYEMFAKYNQDTKFVAHLERFQREKGCCGIYGPDDWLMSQLRSNMGGGGGGGGYQSLDYGFMQNPSTGKCHLLPPTVPMGCGRLLIEELHIQLNTYAGFMVLESIIGIMGGSFAGYCFFYWLEKEVIVIPEDEVSNLIVLEPESSTDNAVEASGYLQYGSGDPYLGPPTDFPPGGYPLGSLGGSGRPSNLPSQRPTGYSYRDPTRPPSKLPSAGGSGGLPPAGSTRNSTGVTPSTGQPPINPGFSVAQNPLSQHPTAQPPLAGGSSGGVQDRVSRASGYRSHYHYQSGSGVHKNPTYLRQPTIMQVHQGIASSRPIAIGSASRKSSSGRPHSKNHMLHKQEKALGGKLLGEMHIDHSKDSIPELDSADDKGKKGKKKHATVAIVRNRNAPKPKQFLASNVGSEHHGQTGHLAEDIAEMSGNQGVIKAKLDDVVLPVEHGNTHVGPGGYLAVLERENKRKAEIALTSGSSEVGGQQAQFILSSILEPVNVAHAHGHGLAEEERPLIQPHMAGASFTPGEHQHGGYLNAGSGHHQHEGHMHTGSHENAHYLGAGSHEHARYLGAGSNEHNAHHGGYLNPGTYEGHGGYLPTGAHQGAHYLPMGEHQHAQYLNAGSYAHTRSHESNRYIDPGGYIHEQHHEHHHDHEQHRSRSRPGSFHRGSHHDGHYLNAGSHEDHGHHHDHEHHEHDHHEHDHHGQDHHDHHEHDHHDHHDHRGSHEHTRYLPDGTKGNHQDGHYLPHGSERRRSSSRERQRRPSNHQSRSHTSKYNSHRGNSHNNNHHSSSKEDSFKAQILYAPAYSRSPSRYERDPMTRAVQVHHHVMHKSRYQPHYTPSQSRSYRKHSVRTVILYKNPKPLTDD